MSNTAIIATDNVALAQDGESFLDRASEFLTYGIASAATSAGVGIWNTVKAGVNMFGADLSMTDETATVRDNFGRNAAQYYSENKVAADFGGLLASSLIIGVGSINAFRSWQARGIVMDGYKAATGLATPDIVLGSAQVQSYRSAVAGATKYSWANKELWGASRFAATQNLKEAAVAEGVFLLTNNQNALLNPDNLSFVDSSVRAIKEGWMFAVGGAALGTTIDMFRIKGYAQRTFTEVNETGIAQDMRLITSEIRSRGGNAGDQLVEIATLQAALRTDPKFMPTTQAQTFAKVKAEEQLTLLRNELITGINKADRAGVTAVTQMLDTADEGQLIAYASNLRSVERPKLKDFEAALIQYERNAGDSAALQPIKAKLSSGVEDDVDSAVEDLRAINNARVKGNNTVLDEFRKRMGSRKGSAEFFDELMRYAEGSGIAELSAKAQALKNAYSRRSTFPMAMFEVKQAELDSALGLSIAGSKIHPKYATELVDFLTDAATHLGVAKDGYLLAKKYPRLTRLLQKHDVGAIQPLGTNSAFYNSRTGLLTATAVPRARDLGAVSVRDGIINVQGMRNSYPYRLDAVGHKAYLAELTKFKNLETATEHPAIAASAHWDAAYVRGLDTMDVQATDLPRLEVFATKELKDPNVKINVYSGDKKVTMTQAEARAYVVEQKVINRAAMQAAGRSAEEIAIVLNTGEKFAIGQMSDDVILSGVDYTKGESVLLRYKEYRMDDVDMAARSFDGMAKRAEMEYAARQRTSGDVLHSFGLGELEQRLPQERMDIIKQISETDPRATLSTSAQTRFGSLREWAAGLGAMTNKAKDSERIRISEEMHNFFETFNRPENFAKRAELAMFNNAARTNDYYVVRLDDGSGALAYTKKSFASLVESRLPQGYDDMAIAEQRAASAQLSESIRSELANRAVAERMIAAKDGNAYLLGQEVSEVVLWHMQRNARYIDNDMNIAKTLGRHVNRDPNVYYAPPPNLQRSQFVAFVLPKESGTDAPRFMLYAGSQAELDAKRAYVAANHPTYATYSQNEISSFKKLMGEYDRGRVFDELEFDPNLRAMGKSGDFKPSLDVYGTETLDRIRNWHHNKSEHQIMSAIELRYADTVQTLRNTNTVFREQAVGTNPQPSTIYEDTVNLMLDKASQGGQFHQLYTRVQDVFGAYGSKALDVFGGKVVELWRGSWIGQKRGSVEFKPQQFEAVLKELDAKGFQNPYKDIESYLANSAQISDGRSAAALSRLASTFVAGLTLRLDWLNSFVQVMSTPILLSGVIREAKLSTRDARLVQMSTVRNPTNGALEPTTAKIMTDAMRTVFTPEGKALMEEARKRGILQDYTRQYLEATDFSSLNGRHTMQQLQEKVDTLISKASVITGHMFAEDFSRALVMNSMWRIAKTSGLSDDAAWAMVRSGVDKVHGIYRAHSRVQLFNGVIGQSMGLFQTYMFNMAQNVGRAIQDGRKRDAFVMAVMQGSIFGARSLPAFGMLNKAVADTNSGMLDIYSLAGSDADPNGMANYFLYGMASNLTVIPTDAYSRGDIAIRHSTVVPLNPADWPAVAMISKAVANVVDVGKAIETGADWSNALAYGLAHNALNRPLQGVGTMWLDNLTTQRGTPLFTNVTRNDYNPEESFNYAAAYSRVLGGKPLAEAIALDSYYRRTAYQTEQRNKLTDLGKEFRIASMDGTQVSEEAYTEFMSDYVSAGGTVENFNGWVGRQLLSAQQGSVDVFKANMQNTTAGKLYGTLMAERRNVPVWEDDNIIGDTVEP